MDKIDVEGFLAKNRLLLLAGVVAVLLIAGSFFGYRYYKSKMTRKADNLLWKGVNGYMSFNGKNPEALVKSVSYLKQLKTKYKGTDAAGTADFYLGLDYNRLGKLHNSVSYFTKYVKIYPKPDPKNLTYLAYSNMASIAILQKDYNGAIAYFSDMVKIDNIKLQEYALLEEAALYTQIKKPKKAVSIYKKMLTNDSVTKDRGFIENLIQLNS